MKRILIGALMGFAAIPAACFGQTGNDINQAIPIYFGQTTNDTIDSSTRPWQVYSIALAKGQQVTVLGTANNNNWSIFLLNSSTATIQSSFNSVASGGANVTFSSQGIALNYQVATAGVYYIAVLGRSPGISYSLQVTAQGTPITATNPPQAGCLTGQVDSITYSLALVAAGLPDSASIGGTLLCPSCTVKPPAYPLLVSKLETAMGLKVGVSACYDAAGNVFQLQLLHP